MAEFAPVASLPIYKRLLDSGDLGNYHLLIASEVLKDVDGWHDFWTYPPFAPEDHPVVKSFIIMDNGLIETGKPLPPLQLFRAAEAVDANCIVLPDKLGNYDATRKLFLKHFAPMSAGPFPLMGVLQGQTYADVRRLLSLYVEYGVQYVSVPRVMVDIFGSRIELVHMINSEVDSGLKPWIHLLGFSNRLEDDMIAASHPMVMGIDSAVPIWMGLANEEYLPSRPPVNLDLGRRPKNYWSLEPDPHTVNIDIVNANVRKVRAWLTQYAAKGAPTVKASA
jgi:hypothetical protein